MVDTGDLELCFLEDGGLPHGGRKRGLEVGGLLQGGEQRSCDLLAQGDAEVAGLPRGLGFVIVGSDCGPSRAGSATGLATGARTASRRGRICDSCLIRIAKSHARSNFFHPAL